MILVAAAAAAATPSFARARAIRIDARVAQPMLVTLALPQEIDGGAEGTYDDLRVVDASGSEVPYALDPSSAPEHTQSLALSDVGFVPGRFTEALVDYGDNPPQHDALTLQTSRDTFFENVDVSVSDDRKLWKSAGSATIYRVAQHGDEGTQTISYASTHARYVRLRVLDGAKEFPIGGAFMPAQEPGPALQPLQHTETPSQRDGDTIVDIDTGSEHPDIAALTFETQTATFARDVEVGVVQASTDEYGAHRTSYEPVAAGRIARYAQGSPQQSVQLTLHERRFRIVIHNGNDAPLRALRVRLQGRAHRIVFQATPNQSYRILWDARVSAPSYDLGDQLAHTTWNALPASVAEPASPVMASAQRRTSPSLLSQIAMPAALALAALVLAGIVISTLRKRPAP